MGSRRSFLRAAATGAAALAGAGLAGLTSCDDAVGPADGGEGARPPLRRPQSLAATGATLAAASGIAAIAADASSTALLFNGQLPGPTLRARGGSQATIGLLNQLGEPTIVHWHGLIVPAEADGHPRNAIGGGASYDYAFPIAQRAGTFWYHPHPHHLTADQVHRGLAGFFIVDDDEEDALGLPSGAREVLLMLQDRDGSPAAAFQYAPDDADRVSGMLRDVPFGNGIRRPSLEVTGARYRFRVLNASQARVYRLGLENGAPLTVIGNDGGLLPSAVEVESVFLSVGERVDFLVDFAAFPPGSRAMLKSLPFTVPFAAAHPHPQGIELDLLELRRGPGVGEAAPPLPSVLSSIPSLPAPAAERTFVFRSTADEHMHTINGLVFDMDRVDEQVPLGRTERWIFHNDSTLPHPVHLHGTHFQVVARAGGRNAVYPYEGGWKDTVLLMPLETVEVLVRFDRYRGIYPLHCHNLQHEDMGMMLNVEVV